MNNLNIIIPWIFALLTLLLSFFTARSTAKTSLLNINKTVLSENRQVWINTVRETITQYITVHTLLENPIENGDNFFELYRELTYLQTKIILLLNPLEKESNELVIEVTKIAKPKNDRSEINANEVKSRILVLTQRILKKEWERVKSIN